MVLTAKVAREIFSGEPSARGEGECSESSESSKQSLESLEESSEPSQTHCTYATYTRYLYLYHITHLYLYPPTLSKVVLGRAPGAPNLQTCPVVVQGVAPPAGEGRTVPVQERTGRIPCSAVAETN